MIEITSINQFNIINYLINNGKSNYKDLIEGLKTSRTTIVDNCHKLLKAGVIIKSKEKENTGKGRPITYWKLK